MTINKDMGYLNGQMEKDMKDIGRMGYKKVKENSKQSKEFGLQGNGKKVNL